MKAHLKASMTTRLGAWYVVAANRRDYMRHVAILGA
jgi:hypothetical protein